MTELEDPPRLLDPASGAPEGLRQVLGAAERDVGSAAQLARLSVRLGPLLAAPASTPTAKVRPGMGAAAKVGLSALALLLAGGGAWLLSTSQSATPPAPSLPAPPAEPAPAQGQSAPAPVTSLPAAPPSEASAGLEADKPEPPAATTGEKQAHAQLSEAGLLEQARAALRSDPGRALARANEHRRRFPGGVLVQEREVIAIKALRQLGRNSEADQRAAAFEKAFPGSAFQRKLKPSP
ncbi:MAG TPA: hypothetical protein VJN18_02340 [Polyangiaceae bacterium]|nr:hypothetical protein [Polyangiaceae bacterium]